MSASHFGVRSVLWLIAGAAVVLAPAHAALGQERQAGAAAVAQYSLSDVQAAIARLQEAVQDRFATEAALESARSDLHALVARADELADKEGQVRDAAGPAAAAQLELRRLLDAIEARLGTAPETGLAAGPSMLRVADLPVPAYEGAGRRGELAAALRDAQAALRDQLRQLPGDSPRVEASIADLVVTEERLAWEAGWPFAPDEVADLKSLLPAFAKLRDEQRSGPDAGRVSTVIKGVETARGATLEQLARRPDSSPAVLADLRPAYDELAKQGDVNALNDIDRKIADVYARRRARGVAAINARLSEEALSAGRDAPRPFVIHRPATRAGQREIDRRVAELVAAAIGLPLQPSGPGVVMLSVGTRPFDDALKAELSGRQ